MTLNWNRIMLNLRAAGLSMAAISRRIGMDQATCQRLARGEIREPKFSHGIAILDLHLALCPERHNIEKLRLVEWPKLRVAT